MAVATYTTNLTTIAIGSITVDAGTWDESSDAAWDDAGAMVDDGNLYYNGSACVSAQFTKDGVGTILYDHTSDVTIPTDGAALIHHLWAAPPALSPIASGGIRIIVGEDVGSFFGWNQSGSDFLPAPKGGWTNYAINPGVGSPDYTVGTTPSSPYSCFGIAVAATAQARGNPNAVNAIRYGRCDSVFEFGQAGAYATFLGFGTTDSNINNKWSLIDPVEGGYKYQGLMSIGTATNAVDFRDANVNLTVANTINVTFAFNTIEVLNTSSNIEWTAISISALGTTSPGTFVVTDNATLAFDSCTFTDMGTFTFNDGTNPNTITGTVFRRCNYVDTGGATFTGCVFSDSSAENPSTDFTNAAVYVSSGTNAALVSGSTFESGGTGYGMEIAGAATDFTFTDNTWTDYAATNGITGNEAIHILATTGTFNITKSGGTTPTVHTEGATVNILDNVTVTVTIKDGSGNLIGNCAVAAYRDSDGLELVNELTPTSGVLEGIVSFSVASDTPLTIRARKNSPGDTRYFPTAQSADSGPTGFSTTITLVEDAIAT